MIKVDDVRVVGAAKIGIDTYFIGIDDIEIKVTKLQLEELRDYICRALDK